MPSGKNKEVSILCLSAAGLFLKTFSTQENLPCHFSSVKEGQQKTMQNAAGNEEDEDRGDEGLR